MYPVCPFWARLALVVIAIVFGGWLIWQPKRTIEIQIALYRPFNWKLEPISMEKEIRNTRIMGIVLLALGVVSLILVY